MRPDRLNVPQRVSAVAIVLVALGAFLPWVSVFGISRSGLSGDGVITLVLAVAGAIVLVAATGAVGGNRTPGRAARVVLLVLACLVALIALIDMNSFAAIGLYLTLFAGIGWVAGAIWDLATLTRATPPPPPPLPAPPPPPPPA